MYLRRLLKGFAGNKFRHGYHQNIVGAWGLLVLLFSSNQPEVACIVKFTKKYAEFAVGPSGVCGYTKFLRCRQRLKRKRFGSRLWKQVFSIQNICDLAAVEYSYWKSYWILLFLWIVIQKNKLAFWCYIDLHENNFIQLV